MLEDLLREGAGTFIGRWYVTLFGIVFVWCAVRDIGWRRTVVYTLVALVVGGLAENGSVHLGAPADTVGGSFFLMWIPAAAVTAVLWSQLRAERVPTRSYGTARRA